MSNSDLYPYTTLNIFVNSSTNTVFLASYVAAKDPDSLKALCEVVTNVPEYFDI